MIAQIPNIFYFSAFVSLLPLIGSIVYLPKNPQFPPNRSQQLLREPPPIGAPDSDHEMLLSTLPESKTTPTHYSTSFIALIVLAAALSGMTDGWQGCYQSILNPVGISDADVGWIGFATCCAGNFAAISSGVLMDRVYRRRLKPAIIVFLTISLISTIWFTLAISLDSFSDSQFVLLISIIISGAFREACSPLFYELSAELIYPQQESQSGGMLVFLLNMFAAIMISLDDSLTGDSMNFVMCGVMVLVISSIAIFVNEEYKRPSTFFH